MVHVCHGQFNSSPDFSWFVKGLATYASGQFDSLRLEEIKKAVVENKIPVSLNSFWTGNLRYELSGSVVLFIDKNGEEIL